MAPAKGIFAALAMLACTATPVHSQHQLAKHFAIPHTVAGLKEDVAAKAATTSSVASRAFVSASTTVYGGFELASSATVYILVRGNSLGTLGVTQSYLDAPRVRLYNSQGQDLVTDGSRAGFNSCLTSNTTTDAPVIGYYQNVRGQPPHPRDTCLAFAASAGVYTFSVTPSIPGLTSTSANSAPAAGEVLFEVTLGPPGTAADPNRERTERLVGGTWTFVYSIISVFSNRYSFTTVRPSTASPGDWVASGSDEFGNVVIGTYSSATNTWAVLDPGTIIDRFFIFRFDTLNRVSGCYHQVNPPGSTNMSDCYGMVGTRSPPKSLLDIRRGDEELELAEAAGSAGSPDAAAVRAYGLARQALEDEVRNKNGASPKAASARSVASRATVSPTSTVYGGFELATGANVYILVRGNSLGTLGVTQAYLDLPKVRVFDSQGRDQVFDVSGRPGFASCVATNQFTSPVVSYYNSRGSPANSRDACVAAAFAPGAYTFSVTPATPSNSGLSSQPPFGEILFEVTLGP